MEPHLDASLSSGADASVKRRQMFEAQAPFLLQARLIARWKKSQPSTQESPDSDVDSEVAWIMRYSAAFRNLFNNEKDYVMAIFDEGRMRDEELAHLQARLDQAVEESAAA